jgi:hypothetical protein
MCLLFDAECGADSAHGGTVRLHQEWPVSILGDAEQRPAAFEEHLPYFVGVFHAQPRLRVDL